MLLRAPRRRSPTTIRNVNSHCTSPISWYTPCMIFSYLLAAFIVMPVVEIAVLIRVHNHIGLANTIALVIITGVAGAIMARAQGFMVLMQLRRDMAEGTMPAPRLMDGVMILIAGVLMITPGLITDSAGFLLLMPPVRAAIRGWLRRKVEESIRSGNTTIKWRG